MKFNDITSNFKLDTVSNAIWKAPKNCPSCANGDWMIGKMKDHENPDFKNPKIRGNECRATPDKCTVWDYVKENTNEWAGWNTNTASGINVKCMKGKKFLQEAIVHHFKIIFLQKPYISS